MDRLAQFGLGGLGTVMLSVIDGMDGVEIVAGADPSEAARDRFESDFGGTAYPDYEMLLAEEDDLDVVNVVSPHAVHFEQTMAALDAGLSVHVEKPMVTGVDDAAALTEAVEDREEVVQVGYQRHFDPRFGRLREVVADGTIGELGGVNCFLEQDWIDGQTDTWRTDPDLSGGGQLYDSGSHLLDALLWTTDAVPQSVSADIEYDAPGVDVHSSLSVTLDREGQHVPASVFVTGDGPTGPETREGLYVWGSEGSAEFTDDGLVVRHGGETEHHDVSFPGFETLTERKLDAFLGAAAGERENPVPPATGLQVIGLTEAAYLADERGERVDVQTLIDTARGSE
jgi:predicted dehydrogenase